MSWRAESLRRTGIVFALGVCLLVPAIAAFADAGEPAPPFSLQTLDGKTVSRDSLKGKVVLLDFWATWCVPCLKALPELKDLRQKNAGQPLVIVSVSVDEDKKTVQDFASKNGMDWLQAWDRDMKAVSAFRVDSFPSYVILDSEGRIAYRQRGWAPGRSAAALGAAVNKALESVRKPGAKGVASTR
ncbi:MAG TPA: TlpA disulfide reductase family protein [Thermoanaerobaculia bacterium]|nr:TlpA disulfide reductase family protein [Thermoanaerobaculia bacterium]